MAVREFGMLPLIFLVAAGLFGIAYIIYGRFLDKRFDVSDDRPTPSHSDYDGIDRVPAHRMVLLGHHFSSIAGAGPIVGPIIAATAFGLAPAFLWIIFGAILIGGVHDYSSLMASIRHKGRSIAEIAREHLSPISYKLLLLFIWLALVYVLTVFTDLTSTTFVQDGGVATSSLMFMALAVGFGLCLYRLKWSLLKSSLIFVPLVFLAVGAGQLLPLSASTIPCLIGNDPAKTWDIVLLIYCFIASVTPVWILLQPRDYLSSYLLYASLLGGLAGILLGGFALNAPLFIGWSDPKLGPLFPILFITVACGACSGFHSIVASGTSSKQLNCESDARPIGYGAMLIEGLVAVIALATVAMLPRDSTLFSQAPLQIYGAGMGKFLAVFGLPEKTGVSFGLLALSTFILTTLDTATRLSRYIFEEFFGMTGKYSRYVATLATIALPALFVLITLRDAQGNPMPAWKAIWPVFGATNQLLAGLALVVIAVWMRQTGKRFGFLIVPVVFMISMTLWSLVILIRQYRLSLIGIIAMVLMVLAIWVTAEAGRVLFKARTRKTSLQQPQTIPPAGDLP